MTNAPRYLLNNDSWTGELNRYFDGKLTIEWRRRFLIFSARKPDNYFSAPRWLDERAEKMMTDCQTTLSAYKIRAISSPLPRGHLMFSRFHPFLADHAELQHSTWQTSSLLSVRLCWPVSLFKYPSVYLSSAYGTLWESYFSSVLRHSACAYGVHSSTLHPL